MRRKQNSSSRILKAQQTRMRTQTRQYCDPFPVLRSLLLLLVHGLILIFAISLFQVLQVKATQYEDHIQRFSLHSNEDCSDPGEFYTANVRNLMLVSELAQCGCMKCFCVWHGMWIFTTMRNYQRAFAPENAGMNQMANPGKICESRKINWHYLQLSSIRHVGNANDSLPGLSLYRDVEFFGRELYLSAPAPAAVFVSLSLPAPKQIKSYGLTGRKRWTIFSNTNFTGNSTCLTPVALNQANAGDTEIKAEAKVSFIVGSIQSGCSPSANLASASAAMSRRRKFYDQENVIALYPEVRTSRASATSANSSASASTVVVSESKLVFDGEELRLTSSTRFRHYSVIGGAPWTIYSGTEYNGKCECLLPPGQLDHTERRREFSGRRLDPASTTAIYYETMPLPMKNNGTRLVGSLRRGCFVCKMPYTDPAPPFSDEYNEYSQENYEYVVDEILDADEELYNLSQQQSLANRTNGNSSASSEDVGGSGNGGDVGRNNTVGSGSGERESSGEVLEEVKAAGAPNSASGSAPVGHFVRSQALLLSKLMIVALNVLIDRMDIRIRVE